jgi:hypothetical protein
VADRSDPTPPPEAPQTYVDAIMRREAETAAAKPAPEPRRKSRAGWLLVTVPILLALTAWNVLRMRAEPESLSAPEQVAATRFAVYLVAQGIEAYRDSAGTLPPTLAALGADDMGVEYARTDSTYTLRATVAGEVVRYRSGEDLRPFAQAWSAARGGTSQ